MNQKYLILFSWSGLVVSLDQLTKRWVVLQFPEGFSKPLLGQWLSLIHKRSEGFAFLRNATPTIHEIVFIGVPVFALVLIVLIYIKLRDEQMLTSLALTSILGGAVGNLIDRIQFGYVVDFIGIRLGSWGHLPSLNIADCAILFGLALFVNTLRQERKRLT